MKLKSLRTFSLILLTTIILQISAYGQAGISKWEYWFDDNFEARDIVMIAASQIQNITDDIDVSGLGNGLHFLNVRFFDEADRWSSVLKIPFVKSKTVETIPTFQKVEMWIDDRMDQSIIQVVSSSNTLSFNSLIDFPGLSDGLHKISLRTIDGTGRWSQVMSRLFIKSTKVSDGADIIAYQFWIDDPVNGSSTIETGLNSDIMNLNTNIDLSGFTSGDHDLYIRFLDRSGLWSVPISDQVVISFITSLEKLTEEMGVRVWPNPLSGDLLNIELSSDTNGKTEIVVIDNTGKAVFVRNDNNTADGLASLDLSELPNGTYIILFRCDKLYGTAKIVISR